MNVILCGLGAIGTIYAEKLSKNPDINLKILVNKERLNYYELNPTFFNGKKLILDYILPNQQFKADIILIATKNESLLDVLDNIENFVTNETIFISLLNGITSEEIIANKYGADSVLVSYYVGHSAERMERKVIHDGVNKIVFGSYSGTNTNIIKVRDFFKSSNINFEIPDDIQHSYWFKFMVNVALNQTTAIYKLSVGEMLENTEAFSFFQNLLVEVEKVAIAEKIKNPLVLKNKVLEFVTSMPYDSKTSMLQDVLANRKTEVFIFAGTVIELAEKHNIEVPYNRLALQKLI